MSIHKKLKNNWNYLVESQKMKGEDPCWDGYEMVGKKQKGGKEVPNCVPINEDKFNDILIAKQAIERDLEDFIDNYYDEIRGMQDADEKSLYMLVISELNNIKDKVNTLEFDLMPGEDEDSDAEIEELTEEQFLAEGGRCTGPTKKAASTRKGKKWMKCVKNPDGKGYKRVHWGQKGVRVTGKSGNTKRKKSFRARHGCSTAKPGTPKYQACKDW